MDVTRVSTRLVLPQLDLPKIIAKEGNLITSLSRNSARDLMSQMKGEKYNQAIKVK